MVIPSTEWQKRAACRGEDPDIFFVGPGDDIRPALAICADCPVKGQCLEYGLWDWDGIFGGTTGRQRRALRRERGGALTQREHGTQGRYLSGCRCEPCGQGHIDYCHKFGLVA